MQHVRKPRLGMRAVIAVCWFLLVLFVFGVLIAALVFFAGGA